MGITSVHAVAVRMEISVMGRMRNEVWIDILSNVMNL